MHDTSESNNKTELLDSRSAGMLLLMLLSCSQEHILPDDFTLGEETLQYVFADQFTKTQELITISKANSQEQLDYLRSLRSMQILLLYLQGYTVQEIVTINDMTQMEVLCCLEDAQKDLIELIVGVDYTFLVNDLYPQSKPKTDRNRILQLTNLFVRYHANSKIALIAARRLVFEHMKRNHIFDVTKGTYLVDDEVLPPWLVEFAQWREYKTLDQLFDKDAMSQMSQIDKMAFLLLVAHHSKELLS